MADQQKRDEPAGSPPPPYLSADGRLVVKLKLPKLSEDDSGAAVSPPPPEIYPAGEIKSHQCTECNKSFSSGKALGGHMSSAHVQANKDHSLKKLKSKMKRYSGSGSGSGSGYVRELICRICGKDFPSRKSLFGHMRCHPERDWRGMDPPPSPGLKINSPEASMGPGIDNVGPEEGFEVNEVDMGPAREDLSKSLSGWAQTAKRGRQVMSSSLSSSSRSRSDNEAIDVFYKLLQLLKDKKDEGVEGLSSNSMTTQGDNVSEVGVVESKKRKRDSSLRICEPEDNIDSNFPSKDNESNSTINNDLMNVEQLEGIKSGVQHELLVNEDKLKGAKCNTEIQENRATGGGAESRTGNKNGGEKRPMDTQENPSREGQMETQENPRSEGRVNYRSEKGKAKCRTGNENDLQLEEEGRACTSVEKGKAKCRTSIEKDEELEEGEIEVEKDEELEEGEIEVQKDEQLEEGEIEVQKYAQRKPLLGGMAKCHTGTHNNPCEGGAKCGSSGQTMENMFEQRAKCRTRTQNTEKMPPRDSKSSEASEDDQGKHICDICNRSFTTHQALGGHRSSHNKFKINIVNTNEDSRDKSSRRSPSQRAPTNDEENSLHLCNICNKNFPSGRALGGHKRCHADQGAGPSSSHGKDEKDTKTAHKVLLFDLNEMPDEKDEDVQ